MSSHPGLARNPVWEPLGTGGSQILRIKFGKYDYAILWLKDDTLAEFSKNPLGFFKKHGVGPSDGEGKAFKLQPPPGAPPLRGRNPELVIMVDHELPCDRFYF